MFCYNHETLTRTAVSQLPGVRDYDVLFVDDGSTDGTPGILGAIPGTELIRHPQNRGIGAAIRTAIHHARKEGYSFMVIMAGNGKDDFREVPRLLAPLHEGVADYVQGSRFLDGGAFENLPFARLFLLRIHALVFTLVTGRATTDASNGFRAYRLSLFDDPRIDIDQDWLDRYELETYLHMKVHWLKYRVLEVAVSKTYPPKKAGLKYSHIRPFIDWWSILRPILLLAFRIRK
jgi:dolichol-phosphate mannosyltransferase